MGQHLTSSGTNDVHSSGKMRMQRDFIRITAENHAILKRILTQQPHYITKKFLLEFKVSALEYERRGFYSVQ